MRSTPMRPRHWRNYRGLAVEACGSPGRRPSSGPGSRRCRRPPARRPASRLQRVGLDQLDASQPRASSTGVACDRAHAVSPAAQVRNEVGSDVAARPEHQSTAAREAGQRSSTLVLHGDEPPGRRPHAAVEHAPAVEHQPALRAVVRQRAQQCPHRVGVLGRDHRHRRAGRRARCPYLRAAAPGQARGARRQAGGASAASTSACRPISNTGSLP